MNDNLKQQTIIGIADSLLLNKIEGFEIFLVNVISNNFDLVESQIAVIGHFEDIEIDNQYVFEGNLFSNQKYGLVFQVDDYRIYDPLNDEIQDDQPQQLLEPRKQKNTTNQFDLSNQNFDNFDKQMEILGVQKTSIKILDDLYGYKILEMLKENPYIAYIEKRAMTFLEADRLADKLNFKSNDSRRIQAAIVRIVENAVNIDGDLYLLKSQIIERISQLVDDDDQTLANQFDIQIDDLIERNLLIENEDKYYFPEYFQAEKAIANQLNKFNQKTESPKKYQVISDIDLDDFQIKAVKQVFKNNLLLISGKPETGKTTIIKSILDTRKELVESQKLSQRQIKLVTPTSRSAQQLSKLTNYPASTLSNLLKINNQMETEYNQENPLDVDIVIIDESSMIDVLLFERFLLALPNSAQLILIGDPNQVPQVGAGQVFADLVNSKKIATITLENVYRRNKVSTIDQLADEINAGIFSDDFSKKTIDRSFVKANHKDLEQVITKILNVIKKSKIPLDEIQILAFVYSGPAGVDALNRLSQSILNPEQKSYTFFDDITFKIGDKVMQTVNDNQREIYSGDQGIVYSIKKDGNFEIEVKFDDRKIVYQNEQIKQLTLAYATTIQKAQGNQFQVAILVLLNQFIDFLNRDSLYTAVTRTQNSLFMIGELPAFQAVIGKQASQRNSTLNQWLTKESKKDLLTDQSIFADHFEINSSQESSQIVSDEQIPLLTQELIYSGNFNPMIGMDSLKPEDFDDANHK